jgi:DNA invertase Pin-like site-specific DNA recombinase
LPTYIAYYRVSTPRQGESGLGLDAQREAVQRFAAAGTVIAEFTEIESGKKHTNRPQLDAALAECKKKKATLVIAKLDRLARNVHFISGLMQSKANFVAVDMPNANNFTVHIMAAVAEQESTMISARTKAALAQVKRELAEKGSRVSRRSGKVFTTLGNPHLAEARVKAHAARRTPPPPGTVDHITKMRLAGAKLRTIVAELNSLKVKTARGSQWYPSTIRALLMQQEHQEGAA